MVRKITRQDYERMGIPVRFWNSDFDKLDSIQKRVATRIINAIQGNPAIGAVCYGVSGTGKSYLFSVIAKELRSIGKTVLYCPFYEFSLDYIRDSYNGDSLTVRDRFRAVDVLMIDGYEHGDNYKVNLLRPLIKYRVDNNLSTLLSVSLTRTKEIEEYVNEQIVNLLKGTSLAFKKIGSVNRWKEEQENLEKQ